MDLKVFWTDTALEQLENIFDYYKVNVSINIAKKIIKQIVNKTIQLEKTPRIGQKEPLLESRKNEYRYLVIDNYKIIYWIDNNFVKIATVFDTRQNPTRLKNEM
ncbi:MAG TPA: type II toxin-antitoxin system RelE/ParE family toxin [Ignavibacteria bacterium]|mgnify:CR=1 FL=1|nr:type II toxin-antitoxin system RelE/ParE family toxin [Ignavibacteria bacterium]